MSKLSNKIRHLSYRLRKNYFTKDNILIIVTCFLFICFAWSGITSLTRNWELERKVETLRLEKAKLEIEVANLQLEQQYYQTDEYKELVARSKQGKLAEGETMVIMPKNSDAALNKYKNTTTEETKEESNFSQWIKFLFG